MILFGLSMDYHVFILSRVREAVDRGRSNEDAVREGILATAGTVTSAAVVMVAVFAIFATLSSLDMKQMGVGLAVAIAIDATLVRAVLLPAVDAAARRPHVVPAVVAGAAAAGLVGGTRVAGRRGGRGRRRQYSGPSASS